MSMIIGILFLLIIVAIATGKNKKRNGARREEEASGCLGLAIWIIVIGLLLYIS